MRRPAIVVILGLILVLVGGLGVIAIMRIRDTAARTQCIINLRHLGMSCLSYADSLGYFPQAGEPNPGLPPDRRLSWIVGIGPYIDATDLYMRMDRGKGWDAEENRYLALNAFKTIQCPGLPDRPPESTLDPTPYVGIAGLGPDAPALPAEAPAAGVFGYERKLSPADVRERAGRLLMIVETAQVSGAWSAAGPPTVRGVEDAGAPYLGVGGQFGGIHRGRVNAAFADGSARTLSETMDPRVFSAIATVQGSAKADLRGVD
jgi:prepilin-type processing-associated H-X9-DG protein